MWLLAARDPEKRWREALPHLLYQLNLFSRWFTEAGMSPFPPASNREQIRGFVSAV